MYLKDSEDLRGYVFLANPNIHDRAKLNRQDFIDRVSCVKEIRTAINSSYLSFYITSLEDYNNLKRFHDLVKKGIFDFDYNIVFLIAIQPNLFNWFKTTSYQTIEKQITFWLASLYFFVPAKRHILEKQLYKPLLEEIQNIVTTYYKEFSAPDFEELYEQYINGDDDSIYPYIKEQKEKCVQKYLKGCFDFFGAAPPDFLRTPFDYERLNGWGINEDFGFDIIESYFLDKDWEFIIVKGGKDDLFRSESRSDLWDKWKHTYSRFDKTKNFVYSFYYPNQEGQDNSTKKTRREVIAQDVKDAVWRRDEGKCVECGSNEKLEFDHIIPFVKGGSSRYRNIQLLCEPCNRKKHGKLG